MFEVGFTEILVIFVLALIVLGPEKLPRVAAQVGRWVGRARAMAKQFRDQLEEEVTVAEATKSSTAAAPSSSVPPEFSGETQASPAPEATAAPTPHNEAPRTEGHGAGPAPEPEPDASVYQPPAYAAPGHVAPVYQPPAHAAPPSSAASAAAASTVESAPTATASHDTTAPSQEPALRPGDAITATHERGI